jgi:hypothetical protein
MNLRYAIDGCLDVCMYVWMYVGNKMYCDETTNATNIPFGKMYLLTIEIDLQSDIKKIRHFGRRRPS